jgi:hypothetical protein
MKNIGKHLAEFISFPVRRACLALLTAGFLFNPNSISAQSAANSCDLNSDGKVNVLDAQLIVNMYLGQITCTANITGPGVCDRTVVDDIVAAALGGTCPASVGVSHSVSLNWVASTSVNVAGYNVYRGTASGGPYTKLTSSLAQGTSYTDNNVQAGKTYYYVATAVDGNSRESTYSTQAKAVVPSP